MGTFYQDLKYGLRMLWKNRGFTVVAVFALALGIGANTAIFSVVNTVLLRPLPFVQPEQLLVLWGAEQGGGEQQRHVSSYPDFRDLRDQTGSLAYVSAYGRNGSTLAGDDEPEQISGAMVSADLFPLLGVGPALGRVFTREEDQPDGPRVIVLGYGLWQRRFGSDPKIIGRELQISGRSTTVVGVMPSGFKFPTDAERSDYWMPLASDATAATRLNNRGSHFLRIVGRLRPGVTLEGAQAELTTVASRLEQQYPETNTGLGVRLVSLHEDLVGRVRPALLVLLGAVGFVLLIACANVANLLLARAAARTREMAIRTALGASRWRVIRQLLTESLLLSLVGGGVGLLLALWGIDLLVGVSPADIPRAREIALDGRVLAFTVMVSLLTGIFFGLAPALHASKTNLNESLKEGSRGSTEGLRSNRVRSLLIVSEVALSLVLLVGAGLLIKSFLRLQQVDPGFKSKNVLTLNLSLPRIKYPEPERQKIFFREALGRMKSLPGVESIGAVNILPLSGNNRSNSFAIVGQPKPVPGQEPEADSRVISPDYFSALGIPLSRGRAFTQRDTQTTPLVLVVNETFARRFFPGAEALGQRVVIDDDENKAREIVGVVGDVRHEGLDSPPEPEYYEPYQQTPERSMTFVARTNLNNPSALGGALRDALKSMDEDLYVPGMKTMDELRAGSVAERRFSTLLLGVFAGVALLLAAVGIYGVMAYSVMRRTHEIGLRIALGAQAADVLKLVVGQGMFLALVGVVVGLAASFALTRVMANLLYEVSATDPLIFAGIALLLAGVAFIACYIPARRATKVDPMIALRYE
ncbi:MAG: ABC transporter permease [Pyrinomonadaceae bacterium]